MCPSRLWHFQLHDNSDISLTLQLLQLHAELGREDRKKNKKKYTQQTHIRKSELETRLGHVYKDMDIISGGIVYLHVFWLTSDTVGTSWKNE